VIDLRSTSDLLSGLQAKMQEYIENGAILGWLIDRKQRTVHVYRPSQAPVVLQQPEIVSGEPELPEFQLKMTKIW
jgi:Uma2 family endonuclease